MLICRKINALVAICVAYMNAFENWAHKRKGIFLKQLVTSFYFSPCLHLICQPYFAFSWKKKILGWFINQNFQRKHLIASLLHWLGQICWPILLICLNQIEHKWVNQCCKEQANNKLSEAIKGMLHSLCWWREFGRKFARKRCPSFV